MRLVLLIVLGMGLTACGKEASRQVDPELESYVQQFEADALAYSGQNVSTDTLIAKFEAPKNPQERGNCEQGANSQPTVRINPTIWAQIPESERLELMYHELGHCVLQRSHDNTVAEDGQTPASLMNAYSIPASLFELQTDAYKQELFTANKVVAAAAHVSSQLSR